MFCAFEGAARIVRLFGTGTVYEFGTPEYLDLIPPEKRLSGSRAAIVIDVHKANSVSPSTSRAPGGPESERSLSLLCTSTARAASTFPCDTSRAAIFSPAGTRCRCTPSSPNDGPSCSGPARWRRSTRDLRATPQAVPASPSISRPPLAPPLPPTRLLLPRPQLQTLMMEPAIGKSHRRRRACTQHGA